VWGGEDMITDSIFSDQVDQYFFGPGGAVGSWYYADAAVNPNTGQLPVFYRGYRANEVAMYAQDDWRIHPRFTMNIGVRWEYFGPPHNFEKNFDSNFYFGSPVTPFQTTSDNPFMPVNNAFYAGEATGSFAVRNTSIWNKKLNNWGPRLGYSWDLLGNQKLVARGGFGMYYDRIYNNVFENIRFNPPLYCDCEFGYGANGRPGGALETPGLYEVPFTGTSEFISSFLFPGGIPLARPRHMNQDLATPYYMQYDFGVQYQLARDMVLDTSYIGTLGRKLVGIYNINTFDGRVSCPPAAYAAGSPCYDAGFPDGFSTKRPNTTISSDNFRNSAFSSNYNALNITLRKRFSAGLQFTANYTFAKSLDELSDAFRGKGNITSPTDPMNLKNDYGPSDFDVRHRFVISPTYDLPFMKGNRWLGGWSVNSIISWNTGSPIAISEYPGYPGWDPNGSSTNFQRPAFTGPSVDAAINTNDSPATQYLVAKYFQPVDQAAGIGCSPTVNMGLWCDSTLRRGTFHGTHFANVDFGIDKGFKITERTKLTFQANFFDLFNHPNFSNPDGQIVDPTFGQSTSTYGAAGGKRIGQLALRFDF